MQPYQFIKITDAKPINPDDAKYKNGDIMRITHVWDSGNGCEAMNAKGEIIQLFTEEFEIMRDAVNSPTHYNVGRSEVIDIIEDVANGYGNGFLGYCIGNALKYICRAPYKHDTPLEDLRKAAKHLDYAINALQREGVK